MFNCFKAWVVAYPLRITVKLLNVSDVTLSLVSCATDGGIIRVRDVGGEGVRSKPFCIEKEGVIKMVPSVVPVCRGIDVAPPLNRACVELAGMLKVTVRPPVANWMEGSSVKTAEVKVNVRVPCNARG